MPAVSKIIAGSLALVIGAGVLGLAIPRTSAAFFLLMVEPIRQKLQKGDAVPRDDLLKLHGTQDAVLSFSDGPGQLYLARSRTELAIAWSYPKTSKENATWREAAERSVERAVSMAPADPYAWVQLTYLRLLNGRDEHGAKDALVMSLLTGPNEQPLVFRRIPYAIQVWDLLSADERATMNDQIRWAERLDRQRLVALAERGGKSIKVILPAVAEDFPRFEEFIKVLNK